MSATIHNLFDRTDIGEIYARDRASADAVAIMQIVDTTSSRAERFTALVGYLREQDYDLVQQTMAEREPPDA
jgi:hypothetical protein